MNALPPPPAAATAVHTSPHDPYSCSSSTGGGAAGGLGTGARAVGQLARGRSLRATRILPVSDPGVGPGIGSAAAPIQIQIQDNDGSRLGAGDPRVGWQAPGASRAAAMAGRVYRHRHTVSGWEPSVAPGGSGWHLYGKGAAGTAAAVQQGAQGAAALDGGVAPSRRSLRGWLSSSGVGVRAVPEPAPGGRHVSDSGAATQGGVTLGPAWRGGASLGGVGQGSRVSGGGGGGGGGGVAGVVSTHGWGAGNSGVDGRQSHNSVDARAGSEGLRPRGATAGGHASARWRAEDTCPSADASSYGVLRHASWTQRLVADGDGGGGGGSGQVGMQSKTNDEITRSSG